MSDKLKAIKEQGRHISSLRGGYGVSDAIQSLDELVEMVASELSEAQAQIAMLEKLFETAFWDCEDGTFGIDGNKIEELRDALSATSETVAAWRAKETEPLRREVAMLREMMKRASVSLGAFCSDEGWAQSDMDTLDSVDAAIAATQATALAYEQEVKAKALENAADWYDEQDRIGNEAHSGQDELRRMAAELRANKGEVK